MLKGGRDHHGKGAISTDLLVCFPTRAHLTLMPKRICSPSRPFVPNTRRHPHHIRKFSNLGIGGGGHASPLVRAKTNNKQASHNSDDTSEPTSPKVTCAGQVKVRSKPRCKNWQSVMEEIERIHNKGKDKKKKSVWMDALGFKKDVVNFLACLRNVRFDFSCFGSFPTARGVISSDDEEEEDEEEEEDDDDEEEQNKEESSTNGDVFSKWFMILQDENNQEREFRGRDGRDGKSTVDDDEDDGPCGPPPPNALLLMRCHSAPAKSWLEEKEEEEEKEKESEKERKDNLVVMKYGDNLSKISCDIAKETWVVGGLKDMLSRSRSSKR